jgi:dienelactone hydrolase
MQFFEIVLVLLALPSVLRPGLAVNRRPRGLDWLAAATLLLAAINFLAEIWTGRYTFRMVPAYLLILATGIPAIIRLVRPPETTVRSRSLGGRLLRGLGLALGLVWWSLALALPLLVPMNTLAPTGPLAVSAVTYEWTDPERLETYTDAPDDHRKIAVQFWYPVDQAAPGESGGSGAKLSSQEPTYPVVIFSHGATGIRSSNSSTYRELASHGYIVASIDHTYLNLFTRFADGSFAPISQRYFNALNSALSDDPAGEQEMMAMYRVRVADMRFTLDQIEAINKHGTPELPAGHLDMQHIGLFGHSAGATTAAETCRTDSRCQAALLIDGTMVFDIVETRPDGSQVMTEQPFPQPMMQINSGVLYDRPDYQDGYAPNRAAFQNAVSPAYNLVIDGASHMNLTDLPLLLAAPVFDLFNDPQMKVGPIDPKLCTQALNAYTLAFFDQYLKDQPAPLLAGPSPDYVFVRYEARN